MPTNVPAPTFTPTGFVAPTDSAILAGVSADVNAAFGGNLNLGTTGGSPTNPTPQGQLVASMAALVSQADQTFLFYSTQTDPSFAAGRFQDAIGRIYFMARIPSTSAALQVSCVGAVGTTIPVGSQVVDPSGNLYSNAVAGTIGASGSATVQFLANVPGFLAVPPSVSIFQAVPGWDTANLISGAPGVAVESRAAFEQRRGLSTAINSGGSLPSILGAVLAVPGVLQATVIENTSSSPVTQGGVLLAANSVYIAVYGPAASSLAVATAIWSRKAPGCAYGAGNTTVSVQDTSPGYVPPFPTYNVTYQNANPLPLLFAVSIVNSPQVPANATTLIQNAIISAGAGGPNAQNVVDGPQATIGGKMWASRFVPPVASLGNWAQGQIISLQIGSNNDPDAASAFVYCSGTLMTVTSMLSGTLSGGQTISISNGSGTFIPGTTIVSQISGSVGGTGTYTTSAAQTATLGSSNQLLQSNSFSTSPWVAVNSTLTPNSGTSPDGTNDTWLWQRSSTALADIQQIISKPPAPLTYTFSMFAKPGTGNYLALFLDDGSGSTWVQAVFNVQTGVVSTPPQYSGSIGNTFVSASATVITSLTGFVRCSLTAVTSSAAVIRAAWSGNANNSLMTGTDSIGNTTILAFGAQLEQGATQSIYLSTTTAPATTILAGFATANQTSVQAQINQIPTIAAGNIAVTYV